MKKILVALLAVILTVVMIIPVVSAANDNNPRFTLSTASGNCGDVVDVAVVLENNPGITALQIEINYSCSDLKLVALEDNGLFANAISSSKLDNDPFKISWYSQDSVDESVSGTLATLQFEILDGAQTSEISIEYNEENVFDINFDNVAFDTGSGKVEVVEDETTTVNQVTEPKTSTVATTPSSSATVPATTQAATSNTSTEPTEVTSTTIEESNSTSEAPIFPTDNTEPSDNSDNTTGVSTEPSESTSTETVTTTIGTEPSSDTGNTNVTTEPDDFLLGDVNKDGKLNIRDATAIQKFLAKLIDFDDEAKLRADFDQNEKINVKDATSIQKKLAGLN